MNPLINPNFTSFDSKEFAFELGGIQYFTYTDNGFSIPYRRFIEISLKQEQISRKKIDLFRHYEERDSFLQSLLDNKNISFEDKETAIKQEIIICKSIRENACLYDYALLASAYFFTEDEDPTQWDEYKNLKKISHILSYSSLENIEFKDKKSFFFMLFTHIRLSLPSLEHTSKELEKTLSILSEEFQTNIIMMEAMGKLQQTIGSLGQFKSSDEKLLNLQMEVLRNLNTLNELQFLNIANTNDTITSN